VVDPRFKDALFTNNPDLFDNEWVNGCHKSFLDIIAQYYDVPWKATSIPTMATEIPDSTLIFLGQLCRVLGENPLIQRLDITFAFPMLEWPLNLLAGGKFTKVLSPDSLRLHGTFLLFQVCILIQHLNTDPYFS
jgi:hypothetical protein